MLTQAQLSVFRAALLAETDPELVSYRQNGQTPLIAEWYNRTATPDYIVWRDQVGKDEITQNGFDWTRLDNLSIGKARVWDGLFDNANRSMNPSKPNVRAGVDAVWVGTAADLAVRAAVYTHCKRPALRIERLFATGLGTLASPSLAVYTGELSETDVTLALQA
jgi:hypothetical protein